MASQHCELRDGRERKSFYSAAFRNSRKPGRGPSFSKLSRERGVQQPRHRARLTCATATTTATITATGHSHLSIRRLPSYHSAQSTRKPVPISSKAVRGQCGANNCETSVAGYALVRPYLRTPTRWHIFALNSSFVLIPRASA